MTASKIAISIDPVILAEIDRLVAKKRFANRSRAIAEAVAEKLTRMNKGRLAKECSKLEPRYEQEWADMGLAAESGQWPEY
jgi:metal-responsive CopG/Arc/MetJ family transcriptional regulator